MVENRPWLTFFSHAVLIAGIFVIAFPLYITFVGSTLTLDEIIRVPMPLVPGDQFWTNYTQVLTAGTARGAAAPVGQMMFNSLVMALVIAFGKIAISIIASFAIVYFRFPLRNFFFWMIFVTLMLPVEVRIIPTFKVVSDLGMINSYVGLTLPLIASATATFLSGSSSSRSRTSSPRRRAWTARGRCASSGTSSCRSQRPAWRRSS
jgi:sn-glycerol 3-phosphate transport system permease protein